MIKTTKTVFNYFTYAGDAKCLFHSIAALRRCAPDAPIYIWDDAANPLPPDVINALLPSAEGYDANVVYGLTDWKRGGNLNGIEAVRGILESLSTSLEHSQADVAVKIDSDVVVNNLDALQGMNWEDYDVLGGNTIERAEYFHGMFYALTKAVVEHLKSVFSRPLPATMKSPDPCQGEDVLISRACYRTLGNNGSIHRVCIAPNLLKGWAYGDASTTDPNNFKDYGCINFGLRHLLSPLHDDDEVAGIVAATMGEYIAHVAEGRSFEYSAYIPPEPRRFRKEIVAIANSRDLPYIWSWRDNHIRQGWDKCTLYVRSAQDFGEKWKAPINDVVVIDWGNNTPEAAFKDYVSRNKGSGIWAAFIDSATYLDSVGGWTWDALIQKAFNANKIFLRGYDWEPWWGGSALNMPKKLSVAPGLKTLTSIDTLADEGAFTEGAVVADRGQFCYHSFTGGHGPKAVPVLKLTKITNTTTPTY